MGAGRRGEWRGMRELGGEREGLREEIWLWECTAPLGLPSCPYVRTRGPQEKGNQGGWPDRGRREPGITGPSGRHP